MRNSPRYVLVLALFGAGCSGGESSEGSRLSLSESPGSGGPGDVTVIPGDGGLVLDCERGSVSQIYVEFDCDEITVYTCKDLSNVVLELADGSHQKSEGLSGQSNTFSTGGAPVAGVWVKAGANHSGDGPGYGERFDAPEDSCDDDGEAGAGGAGDGGDAGTGGSGGEGGSGGCPSTDPDAPCGDAGGLAGSGGEAGEGGEAGSGGDDDPLCGEEGQPSCPVD
jgi:hypothetical protein